MKDLGEMYGACILSKLECICTKVGLYSKYIRTSACVLTLYEKLGGFEEKCVSLLGFLSKCL